LVQKIVRALVDNPDEVRIEEISSGQTLIIELSVAKEDLGKVIGKQGRNADALRTIINCASVKIKKRTLLEIIG
jgi:uncharacterized protein